MNNRPRILMFLIPVCLIPSFYLIMDFSGSKYIDSGKAGKHIISEGPLRLQVTESYKYVGAEKCGSSCHNTDSLGRQYDSWIKSPHAEAFTVLSSRKALKISRHEGMDNDPREERLCLKCHVTGAGLDSSSFSPTYRKEDGVTCEACHKRASDGKTYLPDEKDCEGCHNNSVHSMKKFIAIKGMAKINHPRPANEKKAGIEGNIAK
jgi:hypothetical protein